MLLLLLSSLLLLFELLLFDSDSGSDSVMPDSDAMRRTYSLSAAYLHKLGLATPTQALPPCRLGCTFRAAPAQARKKKNVEAFYFIWQIHTEKTKRKAEEKQKPKRQRQRKGSQVREREKLQFSFISASANDTKNGLMTTPWAKRALLGFNHVGC